MNGSNIVFAADPFSFAQGFAISAMSMSVSNESALLPGTAKTIFNFVFTTDHEYAAQNQLFGAKRAILANVDRKQRAKFDLEPSPYPNMLFFRACAPKEGAIPTYQGTEAPLRGFWCPYIPIGSQGNNPPFVEVPRALPDRNFVFTGAMNGCSIVVTDPGNGNIRLYHDSTHNMNLFANMNVITSLGYDAPSSNCANLYASAGPPNALLSSFNFMYYDGGRGGWFLVSQPQVIHGGVPMRVGLNPQIAAFEVGPL